MTESERLLQKLFAHIKVDLTRKNLEILVPCAGSFPSFTAFRNVILQKFPNVLKLNFTLVEPYKNKIDLFRKKNTSEKIINFEFHYSTLQVFLKKMPKKFDIIYFEHPDLRTITIPFAKLFGIYHNAVSLRKSIGDLHKICKKDTKIIASNMSSHENKQFKYLLKHALNCSTHLINLNCRDKRKFPQSHSAAFQHGLYSEIKELFEPFNKFIHVYDWCLVIFTLIYVISYGVIITNAKSLWDLVIPVLLIGAVYHFHRPNKYAFLLMFVSQIILFIFISKNL